MPPGRKILARLLLRPQRGIPFATCSRTFAVSIVDIRQRRHSVRRACLAASCRVRCSLENLSDARRIKTVYFDRVTRVLTQNCTVVHATRVSTVGLITYFMASAISGRSLWSFFFPRDSSSRISAQKYLRFCVNLRDESPYHQRELRTLETPSGRQGSFATAHRVAVANEIITGLHNSARHDSRPPSKQSLIMKNICFNARRNVTRLMTMRSAYTLANELITSARTRVTREYHRLVNTRGLVRPVVALSSSSWLHACYVYDVVRLNFTYR